jgi:hypothetical protein
VRLSAWKTLGWGLLAAGVGGSLAFLYACYDPAGLLNTDGRIAWPLTGLACTATASVLLLALYRREPLQGRGRWQVGLGDLLLVSIYIGLVYAVMVSISEELFVPWGVMLGLSTGAAFVAGLLLAARRGLNGWRRYPFAFGWIAVVHGALACGAILTTFATVAMVAPGNLFRILQAAVEGSSDPPGAFFWTALFWCGPIFVALGLPPLWWARLQTAAAESEAVGNARTQAGG